MDEETVLTDDPILKNLAGFSYGIGSHIQQRYHYVKRLGKTFGKQNAPRKRKAAKRRARDRK